MRATPPTPLHVALVGNPNTGKTTLFNALCGVRHKTSNFPGTTQEARVGRCLHASGEGAPSIELIDLPGVYSLELDLSESEIVRRVLAGTLAAPGLPALAPHAVCVVVDATNLERNLLLVGEVCRRRLPMVIALTMTDLARAQGIIADADGLAHALATRLGCPVVACSGREAFAHAGESARQRLERLVRTLSKAQVPNTTPAGTQEGLEQWAAEQARGVLPAGAMGEPSDGTRQPASAVPRAGFTDRADALLTHPVLGLACFALVMFGLFYTIFTAAQLPMGLIEAIFGTLTGAVKAALPAGILADFLADGVIAGVGSTLVFLPQICLLFFLISLLEDTGYLARAAFLVGRFLRPFGLSGYAFVPLLSSHACALPGIMATRAIPDPRERLAAILSAPFMSCSARIPVYVLLTSILFPGKPAQQALAFIGCYALGALAGLCSAALARGTILRGKARAMALELPSYKRPSLRTALLTTWDRALVFLKKAGTMILAICVVLWWLGSYPHSEPPARAIELRAQAAEIEAGQQPSQQPSQQATAAALLAQADRLEASHATAHSFLGRIGRSVQPVFAPLGYDWQLTVGVIASFAAREVFASTMAVVTSAGDDPQDAGTVERIARTTRDDGVTPVFTPAVSWSLLVYFVLAMQCLPTLAVTAKESGHAKWALLQLVWMCGVAYMAALVVYQALR